MVLYFLFYGEYYRKRPGMENHAENGKIYTENGLERV